LLVGKTRVGKTLPTPALSPGERETLSPRWAGSGVLAEKAAPGQKGGQMSGSWTFRFLDGGGATMSIIEKKASLILNSFGHWKAKANVPVTVSGNFNHHKSNEQL
jgi:hypothetical protein